MELSDQLTDDDNVATSSIDQDQLQKWETLLIEWSPDSFQHVIDLASTSSVKAKSFFSRFAWELFDKVIDFSLSSFSEDILSETVKLIALNCRPRELYMMVVEKLAGEGFSNEPSGLSILLFAMQLALNELSSPVFLHDGLLTVLKAVIDCSANVNVASNEDHSDKKTVDDNRCATSMKIVGIALNFCEGLATKNLTWRSEKDDLTVHDPPPNSSHESNATSADPFKDHHLVGFLLGLCGECVVSLSAAQRAICVQRAISIITEKTGISVESILLHPHRVRYWMLLTDSCTHGLSKAGNSRGSGISAMDCIRTPEGCRGLVMRHLRCDDTPNIPGNNSEDGSTSCPSGDHSLTLRVSSYLKFSAQELVPWESVTDLALRVSALSDLSTPFDEDDTAGSSSSSAASRRLTCRRRHLASVKRRRVQCGLDVSNLSRTQTDATNESDTTWMLLGASMVAEQVLSTLTTSSSEAVNASHSGMTAAERELEASRGASYGFPRVYSPEHLWEVFYPHMLVLLKAPALAAAEGLALMCHLGPIMGALKQQEESLLTARMRCRAPPLFVPSSMLSIRVTESDPKSAKKAQGGVEADADSDPEPYSMKSAGCILRTVTSSALGNRDKADSLSPSHSAVDSTLNRVKTISSALSIAGSANALVLSQAILNALMSCSDDSLRKRSLVSLREYLSLFDHVSLLGLLQVLKRDCPFPRVGGLLLDIVRDHSQACSVSSMSSRSPLSHTACLAAKNSLSCTSQAGSTGPHDVRRITREDAAPLLWDGSGSSIFFSEVSLRAFCVPPLEKIRDASTQQILDSVDEIGGAINLLLHYSIKISRILKDLATDSPALIQQLHSFLGQQGGNATEGDVTSNDESNAAAVTITRDLFHIEIRSLVEEVAQVVRSKLLKVESKVGGASGGFLPRNPWQTPEERGASTVVECEGEGEEAAVDAAVPVPLPPSDLLQLEIILDNLEFLLRVL